MAPDIIDVVHNLPREPGHRYWRARPVGAITRIVVHYDGVYVPPRDGHGAYGYDPLTRYVEQARYHIRKNWNEGPGPALRGFGLMYHYRVSADGRVWRTQPDNLVTWHARAANFRGLAVCADLGPGQRPTEEQLVSLHDLLDHLCYHRPDFPASRPDVYGHGELQRDGNHTPCPGLLLDWVRAYRQTPRWARE